MPRTDDSRYELVWPTAPPELPALTPSQAQVLASWSAPVLVLGGPGTGKTTVVAHAACSIARDTGHPLVFARTRQAASGLRNLVTGGLAGVAWQPAVTTVFAFCLTVMQRFAEGDWRLLTAPEQEYTVREMLDGRRNLWPADLQPAIGTSAFARQVRAALARARQLGLDPADVESAGKRADDDAWVALGRFFAEYLDVLDAQRALDYAELVHRARIVLARPEVYQIVARDVDAVLVDDYPELDPAQVGVVAALVPRGARLLATGDPHTVLSAFRGSYAGAVASFPSLFTAGDGSPGVVTELPEGHRQGGALAAAVGRVASELAAPAVGGRVFRLTPSPAAREGGLAVLECPTEAEQADVVAREIRRARLAGLQYADMAVLVRSGAGSITALSRALGRAGVPVRVAPDDVPLAQARPVQTLLAALSSAAAAHTDERTVEALLSSPLGGLGPVAVRRLVRAHRATVDPTPMPVGKRLAQAVDEPSWCAAADGSPELERFRRFAELLGQARAMVAADRPADEIAWDLWQRSGWAAALATEATRGGALGTRAESDLEALREFFAFAGERERRGGAAGVRMLVAQLDAQQIPADYEREARRGDWGVEVTTVHRAKGRQWPLVVVVGASEGVWPAVGRAPGRLAPERLRSDGLTGATDAREHVAAERRAFYAACATASQRLVVTYAAQSADTSAMPSRFVRELGVQPDTGAGDDQPRDVAALVAQLRREAISGEVAGARREAAAAVLARLASERTESGEPLVVGADPATWWGVRDVSGASGQPRASVTLSPSQVTAMLTCPRQYFLAREVRADEGTSGAQGFGTVIHCLIQRAEANGWTPDELSAALDESWADVPYDIAWVSAAQRDEAQRCLERYLAWRQRRDDVELAGVEVPFRLNVVCGGIDVTLAGRIDRLERLPDDSLRVIDFKTSSSPLTIAEAAGSEQLGIYQLAVGSDSARCAGAALVYLRQGTAAGLPVERSQAALWDCPHLDDADAEYPTWVHERVTRAALIVEDGSYPATPGGQCARCAFAGSCPASGRGEQVIR